MNLCHCERSDSDVRLPIIRLCTLLLLMYAIAMVWWFWCLLPLWMDQGRSMFVGSSSLMFSVRSTAEGDLTITTPLRAGVLPPHCDFVAMPQGRRMRKTMAARTRRRRTLPHAPATHARAADGSTSTWLCLCGGCGRPRLRYDVRAARTCRDISM
jgi:hypothetical protein